MATYTAPSGGNIYGGRSAPIVNNSVLLNGGDDNRGNRITFRVLGTEIVNPLSQRSINVGSVAYTHEFWFSATAQSTGVNDRGSIGSGPGYSVAGNFIWDGDRYNSAGGPEGGQVIMIAGGEVTWAIQAVTGSRILADVGNDIRGVGWRHIAVQFDPSNGAMELYVNGDLVDSGTGPVQNISYPVNALPYISVCGTTANQLCDFSMPFWHCGVEKHDLGNAANPGASGLLGAARFSVGFRYSGPTYTIPGPFVDDNDTLCLYRFNENNGNNTIIDSASVRAGIVNSPGTLFNLTRSPSSPYA